MRAKLLSFLRNSPQKIFDLHVLFSRSACFNALNCSFHVRPLQGGTLMSNRLIHSFKPPIKRLVACSLSLLLIGTLLPATIGVHPCKAQAQTKPTTISTLLGISRQDFVSYLTNNKDNYLNTAYKPTWPNPTTYQTGPWWHELRGVFGACLVRYGLGKQCIDATLEKRSSVDVG